MKNDFVTSFASVILLHHCIMNNYCGGLLSNSLLANTVSDLHLFYLLYFSTFRVSSPSFTPDCVCIPRLLPAGCKQT